MGVAASAYIVRLGGELASQDDEGYVEQAYVVATDRDAVVDALLTTDPGDRFPELLRRAVAQHVIADPETEAPFQLVLYTVQQGRIQAELDLRPHVTLVSTEGTVTLDRVQERDAWSFNFGRFTVNLPALAPLAPPVLQPGKLLTVLVPDELEDMTELGLGETEIMS